MTRYRPLRAFRLLNGIDSENEAGHLLQARTNGMGIEQPRIDDEMRLVISRDGLGPWHLIKVFGICALPHQYAPPRRVIACYLSKASRALPSEIRSSKETSRYLPHGTAVNERYARAAASPWLVTKPCKYIL